jgi:hypothetical protein
MFSNLLVVFITAFVLTEAPVWTHSPGARSTFDAAKNAFEGCHRTNTKLAKLSENPQEILAANLD